MSKSWHPCNGFAACAYWAYYRLRPAPGEPWRYYCSQCVRIARLDHPTAEETVIPKEERP